MPEMLIIDRLAEGFAICETPNRSHVELPLALLPEGAREGDCLVRGEDGVLRIDQEETLRRRKMNSELFRMLKKKQQY